MVSERDRKPQFKTSAEVLQSLLSGKGKTPLGRQKSAGQAASWKKQDDGIDHMADQFFRWKLWMNWKDIVGPTTAECCEPISYHQGTLTLWAKNSTWMTQLNFMSEAIKNTINQKLAAGAVREIRVTQDRKNTPSVNDEQFKNHLEKLIKK
ncbi:DUF721 domain-containing protein [Bdellovibrio sp. qaytius]|nr:DUF721 domain-containing protein [Bdellovibrio sp. qaytius]